MRRNMTMADAFVIDGSDNVATALEDLAPGTVSVIGERQGECFARENIPRGHKIALCDLHEGEYVVKHGGPVAVVTRPVAAGEWVHVHNVRSMSDH